MQRLIVANWKANLSPRKVEEWLGRFRQGYRPVSSLHLVLAVPDVMLFEVRRQLEGLEQVSLAAQGVSPFPSGSYTGSTPAAWLRGRVGYALIGHRERRKYFHESVQDVGAQAREAVAAGMQPILCCTREQAGQQVAVLDSAELDQLVLAYTPDDAEQLEEARSMEDVQQTVAEFKGLVAARPVLYGGGVHQDNCAGLMQVEGLAGLMVGRESLDPAAFLKLLDRLA